MVDLVLFRFYRSTALIPKTTVSVGGTVIAMRPAFLAGTVHLVPIPIAPIGINAIRAISAKAAFRQDHRIHVVLYCSLHIKVLPDIQFHLVLS